MNIQVVFHIITNHKMQINNSLICIMNNRKISLSINFWTIKSIRSLFHIILDIAAPFIFPRVLGTKFKWHGEFLKRNENKNIGKYVLTHIYCLFHINQVW